MFSFCGQVLVDGPLTFLLATSFSSFIRWTGENEYEANRAAGVACAITIRLNWDRSKLILKRYHYNFEQLCQNLR